MVNNIVRDWMDRKEPSDILVLKKLSDRALSAEDRTTLLETCALIENLRWANANLRGELGSVASAWGEREPHCMDFSLDDDPQAYEKAHAQWARAESARKVLKRTEGII